MIRIAIATLGCKINQAESSTIVAQFDPQITHIVDWQEAADIYIINTCTVTNRTDYKSRYLIRQALAQKAINPFAKIVVTGCFAQRSAEEIAKIGAIDFIVDNQQKLDIAAILAGQGYAFQDIMSHHEFAFKPASQMFEHTRAFQKIQDGCDFYCAYCAVPYARGHSRSAKLEQVLQQASAFVASGYKEIVLGGVNLGLYNDNGKGLAEVVSQLSDLDGLELIRLSSIEPQLFTMQLIEQLSKYPKLCPHFHIPLQSGSDQILSSMKRHYNTSLVTRLLQNLKSAFPTAAIGLDVICGFPGETEADHEDTYNYLQTLPLAYLHVFSYSKRKGTIADQMPHQVPKDEKNRRTKQLTHLSHCLQENYRNFLSDNAVPLRGIVETHKNVYGEAVSDHYLRMQVSQDIPIGQFVTTVATQDLLLL